MSDRSALKVMNKATLDISDYPLLTPDFQWLESNRCFLMLERISEVDEDELDQDEDDLDFDFLTSSPMAKKKKKKKRQRQKSGRKTNSSEDSSDVFAEAAPQEQVIST